MGIQLTEEQRQEENHEQKISDSLKKASQEKRKRERLLDVHRVILDWKLPADDRIRTLLSEKNRTLVGEAGTGAWKQGL